VVLSPLEFPNPLQRQKPKQTCLPQRSRMGRCRLREQERGMAEAKMGTLLTHIEEMCGCEWALCRRRRRRR
jgi:hypothetical protein